MQDSLYYLYDGLGSVVQLTDSTGKVSDKYNFNEFGKEQPGGTISPNASKVLHNNFGYTGEQWDSESGLQYLRARYYDPEIGRFINRDNKLGNALVPLTHNLYTYVTNNPVNFTDPSGHYREGLEPGTPDWFDDIQYGKRWTPDQVKQLQRDLNTWGFTDNNGNKLAEDGEYDNNTRFAHRMYFRARREFLEKGGTIEQWEQQLKEGKTSPTVSNPITPPRPAGSYQADKVRCIVTDDYYIRPIANELFLDDDRLYKILLEVGIDASKGKIWEAFIKREAKRAGVNAIPGVNIITRLFDIKDGTVLFYKLHKLYNEVYEDAKQQYYSTQFRY